MKLEEYYSTRIDNFKKLAGRLQRKENALSVARLVVFVCILLFFFILYPHSVPVAMAASAVCIVVFAVLVLQYGKTEKLKDLYNHLVDINTLELNSVAGDHHGFADGHEFMDHDHANSYDLDLFGPSSVYQFINRTNSLPGAQLLSRWLMKPADMDSIKLRQEAVAELKPEIEWRQQLMTAGHFSRHSLNNPGELLSWMQRENVFSHTRIRLIVVGLTAITLITGTLVISGWPTVALLPVLLVNFLFYFMQGTKINRLHRQVSKSADLAQNYSGIIGMLEKKEFSSGRLRSLQLHFNSFPTASAEINRLSTWVNRLDSRLNIMVSIPLNLFFFWDIHCCIALEKWKDMHAGKITGWIDAMAEFEVLNSMANMAFNNPGWIVPKIVPGYFTFDAQNMGHPLIPAPRRILNNITLSGEGKIMIITGSNMSGKSTFLRTCGVNTILALAGAPVCASSFTISHVEVYSSMRISDSLEDNTSSFYAELKRLACIINKAEQDPGVFLLLDEILRGTNSNDRYTGSVALIKQLSGYGTTAVIATHDLNLAGLDQELPGRINNYHFDVKVDGDELYFDYKLNHGICTSMNASILMKKMGIRI
jgi:hypothetical protein